MKAIFLFFKFYRICYKKKTNKQKKKQWSTLSCRATTEFGFCPTKNRLSQLDQPWVQLETSWKETGQTHLQGDAFVWVFYSNLKATKHKLLFLIIYNHLISNKREWNNCFIKNTPKILDKSPRLYSPRRNRMLQCTDLSFIHFLIYIFSLTST